MLLLTNENHTSTLHSEMDALSHAPFTTVCQYLSAKIQIKIENNHIIAHFYILFNTRALISIFTFWQDNYD